MIRVKKTLIIWVRPLDKPSHADNVGVYGVGLVKLRLGGDGLSLRDCGAPLTIPDQIQEVQNEIHHGMDGPVVDHPEAVITSMGGKLQPARVPLHTKGGVIEESVLKIVLKILIVNWKHFRPGMMKSPEGLQSSDSPENTCRAPSPAAPEFQASLMK